ncbi:MAG: methyltransferase domain-containing protein [Elusimicrobiota bacterium]|nr:methyltransferase domain-containing protein [Elusimicrobiota bacterium]
MKNFGKQYSCSYDCLYQAKDYERECDFLEAAFKSGPVKVKTILDLGCGTGNHALILAKRGYQVTGVDISGNMLALARRKAAKAGLPLELVKGDITRLNLGKKFDAVISMFAVMGYQTSNAALSGACASARLNLRDNGLFIFDCWNGNAVLTQKPGKRVRRINAGPGEKLIRYTTPALDTMGNTVRTDFRLVREIAGKKTAETAESHLMRFFYPQELKHYLETSNFGEIAFCPFPEFGGKLADKDWNMAVICRARAELSARPEKLTEEVRHKGLLLSIILRDGYAADKITFFGQPEFSQQLGFLPHKKGGIIAAHFHRVVHRDITLTQEVLFVKSGKLTVNFYTTGKDYICSRELRAGDLIFLCAGGHGFKMLEDSVLIEVKQGPYSGHDSDKEVFKGIEK